MSKEQNKKRVLIVGQHYWPETFRITDIAEGLVEQGYDVDVLCGTPNYPAGKFFPGYSFFGRKHEVHNGVNIIRTPEIPRGNNTSLEIFLNYISFPLFAMFYVPFFLIRKYDRIIAYQLSPVFMSFPAIVLAKLRRTPLFFYVCDFWPHSLFSMLNIQNILLRKVVTSVSYWHYRRSDGIIGVFKGMQERFITDVGIAKEKTLYIPQAPEKIYESNHTDASLTQRFKGKFTIMFAGNINPAQSFDVITKAAKLVKEKGYDDVHYLIIGDGMSRKWLENEVRMLGLRDSFTFEGLRPVSDIPKYQAASDILLVALSKSPLFEYGIPAKVYSYMPSGKPIVASMDGEGQRLINTLSNCGICVDSGDVEGLAKAIIDLKTMNRKERLQLGQNGKRYYFKHFEREYNLNRLVDFILKNKRVPDNEYPD